MLAAPLVGGPLVSDSTNVSIDGEDSMISLDSGVPSPLSVVSWNPNTSQFVGFETLHGGKTIKIVGFAITPCNDNLLTSWGGYEKNSFRTTPTH